jgi:hypothetical protein
MPTCEFSIPPGTNELCNKPARPTQFGLICEEHEQVCQLVVFQEQENEQDWQFQFAQLEAPEPYEWPESGYNG